MSVDDIIEVSVDQFVVEVEAIEVIVEVDASGPPGADSTVPGPPGPPGPTAVSVDAGNTAVLGTDALIFVPVPPPGGTKILEGYGPPDDALGEDGDYYLDKAGKILYGPKTPPDTEGEWVDAAPTGTLNNYGPYVYGNKYQFNTDGYVTGIAIKPAPNATTLTGWVLKIWNKATRVLLGQAVSGTLTADTYNIVPLQSSVLVTAGTTYTISVYLPDGASRLIQDVVSTSEVQSGNVRMLLDGDDGTTGSYGSGDTYPATDEPKYRSPISPVFVSAVVWPVAVSSGIDQVTADALYVNVSGDTMAGSLKFDNGLGAKFEVYPMPGVASTMVVGDTLGSPAMVSAKGIKSAYDGSTLTNDWGNVWRFAGNVQLLLTGDPVDPLAATPKQYVDSRIWKGTQAEYDAIVTKDPAILYVVIG